VEGFPAASMIKYLGLPLQTLAKVPTGGAARSDGLQ
jgi:hypothetical protein